MTTRWRDSGADAGRVMGRRRRSYLRAVGRLRRAAITLLVLFCLLMAATPSRADIGVIVLEPVGPLGFFTRVGHAATYLSNICPDGSPVKMRLCRPGEGGGVVSKYAPLSQHEDYDWAIVPLEAYLHGFDSPDLAPLVATPSLQRAIEQHDFEHLFASALHVTAAGQLPDGQWRSTLANRFGRSLYMFSIETTLEDDATIVAAFNAAANKSHFNFFYGNCSNQAKAIFDLVRPGTIGDRISGITMETPKGLVKALVAQATEHPELRLYVRRFPQLPGTFPRSREVLFPMENTYKSIGFAPYWFFGGFRDVAVGAIVYHEVLSPFSLADALRTFVTPQAGRLAREQQRLRERQDENRRALASAIGRAADWSRLAESNAWLNRRLGEIREEHRIEVQRVTGSKAQWRSHQREFRAMVRALARTGILPVELEETFSQFEPGETLSARVLQHMDVHGAFSVGELGPGPWLSLTGRDGQRGATGLSRAEVLSGDPEVAVLVLAAAIDYQLYQPSMRRIDIAEVNELFRLFSEAAASTGERRPSGVMRAKRSGP